MNIAFGTDESTPLTAGMVASIAAAGHDIAVVADGAAWTAVGRLVGEAVATGRADVGIVCCFTGTGVSIAANKVAGVRATLCTDGETARGARRWNDANVLALSLRLLSETLAGEIVEAFLTTGPDDDTAVAVANLAEATGP